MTGKPTKTESSLKALRSLDDLDIPGAHPRLLFEALGFLTHENPHSDFISWLLSPGTLDNDWLLARMLKHCDVPDDIGEPTGVEREVSRGGDRPDLVVSFAASNFVLVIENKVFSGEGKNQCARYLNSFGVGTPDAGHLVYLTLYGDRPKSVDLVDERVTSISYLVLHQWLLEGLSTTRNDSPKMTALVQEYAETIGNLTGRRLSVDKPTLTETTRFYITKRKLLEHAKRHASKQSADYVHWLMYNVVKTELEQAFPGRAVSVIETHGYAFLAGLEDWRVGNLRFGVSFSTESRLGKRTLPEYGHLIGIGLRGVTGKTAKGGLPGQSQVAARLASFLDLNWDDTKAEQCGFGSDLRRIVRGNPNIWWSFYEKAGLSEDDDWDRWADGVKNRLVLMARVFGPLLDEFALAEGSGT